MDKHSIYKYFIYKVKYVTYMYVYMLVLCLTEIYIQINAIDYDGSNNWLANMKKKKKQVINLND